MSYRLYVFLRSDLESMTPGKAAAQVAHAASQAAFNLQTFSTTYSQWANEPSKEFGEKYYYEGFGTTIVLDAGSFENTLDTMKVDKDGYGDYPFLTPFPDISWGLIKDPTYPLKDGKKTHFIDIFTCYWMFGDSDNPAIKDYVKQFQLYSGNHD